MRRFPVLSKMLLRWADPGVQRALDRRDVEAVLALIGVVAVPHR